jgi:hypothetical protein
MPPLQTGEGEGQDNDKPEAPKSAVQEDSRGPILDGRPRQGAFLAGPGSLAFILHHTIMGAAGGLATQGISTRFDFGLGSREVMLAGTLIGAGLGFASSAWWQFNHWVDHPMAHFGIVSSVVTGMFFTGLVDITTNDPLALAWTAFVGAEIGAWATAIIGGGQMPLNHALFLASGAGWGLAYGALFMAILGTSGTSISTSTIIDSVLIAPGIGAGLTALATLRYSPTAAQVLRADLFGAGVGGAVLALSALVLGSFSIATPYVLAFVSSVGAITAVTLLWEESAERPIARSVTPLPPKRPYRNVWW